MTYVTTYKQADLTLTGTMRKAQLAATATKTSRRPNGLAYADSPAPSIPYDLKRRASSISTLSHLLHPAEDKRQCDKCQVEFSPKWWSRNGSDEDKVWCHKCHWRTHIQRNHEALEPIVWNGSNKVQDSLGMAV